MERQVPQSRRTSKNHFYSRIGFAVAFTGFIALMNASRTESTNMVPDGQCIIDYSFEMSSGINIWLREHIDFKNVYMIYSHLLMDILFCSFMVLFYFKWNSVRLVFSLILFYPPRQIIQGLFLVGRPIGFLWFFPGIHSLIIPYFDTNDFYWSGHVGSSATFVLEYWRSGWTKMTYFATFVMLSEWFMLMSLRTHYVIDLVTGLMLAQNMHRWGEKLSFYFEVKLMGLPKEKRQTFYYKPCYLCGYNNLNTERYTDSDEITDEKKLVNLKKYKLDLSSSVKAQTETDLSGEENDAFECTYVN